MAETSAGVKTITGYLKKIIGSPVGEIIPLYNKDIRIGRTVECDIRIKDPNISRNHCSLHYSSDKWFITDFGGINGTYLDSEKLMPRIPSILKDGLGIYLGPPSDSPVAFVFIQNKEDIQLLIESFGDGLTLEDEGKLELPDYSIEMTQLMECSQIIEADGVPQTRSRQRKRQAEVMAKEYMTRKSQKTSNNVPFASAAPSLVEHLDEYDSFAQHISSQMRQLPIQSFILLQEKIQKLISQERIKNISQNTSKANKRRK